MTVDELSSLCDELAALEFGKLTGSEVKQLAVAVVETRTSLDAALSRLAGWADDMGLAEGASATSTTA